MKFLMGFVNLFSGEFTTNINPCVLFFSAKSMPTMSVLISLFQNNLDSIFSIFLTSSPACRSSSA